MVCDIPGKIILQCSARGAVGEATRCHYVTDVVCFAGGSSAQCCCVERPPVVCLEKNGCEPVPKGNFVLPFGAGSISTECRA